MRKIVCLMAGIFLLLGLGGPAGAVTLTFDDIGGPGAFEEVPAGYGGLNWSNMWYADTTGFGDGFEIGTVSGSFAAFNGYGQMTTVTGPEPFTFNSAYMTGGYNDGLLVTVLGFFGDVPVYAKAVTVSAYAPGYYNFDFLNIDKLVFISGGGVQVHETGFGTHFVMDDFRINEAPVPVPAAVWLLGSGLVGLIGLRRKLRG